MSYLDDLNAEFEFGVEVPKIGSIEERENALEEADLPSIVPAGSSTELNAFLPPKEVPASVPTGIVSPQLIPKPASVSVPSPALTGVTGQGPIYKAASDILGQEGTIESSNVEFGFTPPTVVQETPSVPKEITESSIDQANRALIDKPIKLGETRATQIPGYLMPSYVSTEIKEEPEKPKKGIITEAIHAPIYGTLQLGQIAAGLEAVAGEALNSDALVEAAKKVHTMFSEFMEPFKPSVQDIRDIGGVGDATRWAVSAVGQMVPFMIGTLGAGAAVKGLVTKSLGNAIARRAGEAAIKKGLADWSVKEAIGTALSDLGVKAGVAGMAATTIGAETGIIASDRLVNGLKVLSSDLLWAIPAGLLDVIPEWRLASKLNLFGRRIANEATRNGLDAARKSFIRDFAKQGLMEGFTEGWQEILEEAGAGRKPFTYDTMWQAINAFMAGGLAGGFMGAGVNLLTRTPPPVAELTQEKLGPPTVPLTGPEMGGPSYRQELSEIGKRYVYPEAALRLPGAQGFNLVEPTGSILRAARTEPAEVFIKREGEYRPATEGPIEPLPGQAAMEGYQDLLRPVRGEGFVTQPTIQAPPSPAMGISAEAQELINSDEWLPLRNIWNKLVMGKQDVPQLMWGGKYPQHLLYDERKGARGLQAPWINIEITESGHVVFTDFDGGRLEALFDKDLKTGTEFVPVTYTNPSGNTTILKKFDSLPQQLIQTIQTYLTVRQQVTGERFPSTPPAGTALPAPVDLSVYGSRADRAARAMFNKDVEDLTVEEASTVRTKIQNIPAARTVPEINPPTVDGLVYNGIQRFEGEPDQYVFTDKETGGTFHTGNITIENLIRERARIRNKFTAETVQDIKETLDKDLEYDLLRSVKRVAPVAEGVRDVVKSGKIAPVTTQMVGGKTKSGVEIDAPELYIPTRQDVETSAPAGSQITKPTDLYINAKSTGNVWVRQSVDLQNNDRILLVQFSTNLINPIPTSPGLDRTYYDKLYSGVRDGYSHPSDFWEIPEWIAVASNSLPNADVYIVRNIDEAVKFFNEARYGKISFSALDANSPMIEEISGKYRGDIVVGGYVDLRKRFGRFKNVKTYDKIDQFIRDAGYKFSPGTNYRHFHNTQVIPRLCLSTGCLHKCSFCDVMPHGKVSEVTPDNVRRQVESIKQLKPKLVYLSDKTFGQAKNFDVLTEVRDELRSNNPLFEGFVIQTTANQFNKMDRSFLANSGIKYVELGVESFNDDLLRQYRKPHRTKDIVQAIQWARENNILVIANVMIGLKGESKDTYNNTIKFLEANKDIISHVNAYNLAVYAGTDLAEAIGPLEPGDINENEIKKSWITDPGATQEFSDKVFRFGISQLDETQESLYRKRTADAPATSPAVTRIPGFAKHMVMSVDGRIHVQLGSVEDYVSHRVSGGRMEPGIIPGLVGEVWVDANTMEVFSPSMYERKLRGEDIRGIPFDQIDGIAVEGWRNEIDKINPDFEISERLAETPIFYSHAERIIDQKMSGRISSEQLRKMLINSGVKADEMRWNGLDDMLAQPKIFTKQEVLDYLAANRVEVIEVLKGQPYLPKPFDEWYMENYGVSPNEVSDRLVAPARATYDYQVQNAQIQAAPGSTKFSQWQLPGGENYRELLLTLPGEQFRTPRNRAIRQRLNELRQQGQRNTEEFPEFQQLLKEGVAEQKKTPLNFYGPHWDEPNVLVHIRFNDRTDIQGKRVLFIEELQSDWHQAGRERGYGVIPQYKVLNKDGEVMGPLYESREEANRVADNLTKSGEGKYTVEESTKMLPGISPAPFSKTWHELAMRRMVRWAADNEYDKIAWTTGEQQAARYDLSHQVHKIEALDMGDGTIDLMVFPIYHEGTVRSYRDITGIDKSKLADTVGKDLAEKILNQKEGWQTYSGLDLKVGGEGMRGFYDKILPEYMNKFGKKWGAKVGETNFRSGPATPVMVTALEPDRFRVRQGTYTREFTTATEAKSFAESLEAATMTHKVHSLDITPSMKESVLQGQPMFRISGTQPTSMTKEEVWKVVNDLKLKLPKDLRLEVVDLPNDIPQDVKASARILPRSHAMGTYFRRTAVPTIFLYAKNIPNEIEARKTVLHELIGHLGFERLIGSERLSFVRDMIFQAYKKEDLAYLYRAYGVDPGTRRGDHLVAMEKIAELSESGENPTLWQRFVVWAKEILANIFGNDIVGPMTEGEIKVYLFRSRQLLEQENEPSISDIYNNMTRLIGMRMWNMTLPDGPAGVAFHDRVDAQPSHDDAIRNLGGWRSWLDAYRNKDKNFGSGTLRDLGVVEAIGSLPHWISMRFPSFKRVANVQWERQDKRNKDRLFLLQDVSKNAGDSPYISLKNTDAVDKIIVWSDQNDSYLSDNEQLQNKSMELNGRALSGEEISAYHGWKSGFDRAISYAIEKLRQSAIRLYSDQPWFGQFKEVIDGTLDPAAVTIEDKQQLKDFRQALNKTRQRMSNIDDRDAQLRSMNFYVPHIRGKGEYVVRVFDTDENGKQVRVWVERFENATKAESARVRLKSDYQGLVVEKTFEPRTSEFVYGGLDIPAMEAFLDKSLQRAVSKFGIDEAAADKLLDTVYKAFDEEIMARGFRQHYIHRHRGRIIGGYRTEGLHGVFFDYMSGLAGSMTKLDATYDFHKALQNIDKVNERGVYEYATRYVRDMLRNTDAMDRKLNAIKTLPYAWYLSMNLRLAVTQMFQNLVTAYPILSRLQRDVGVTGSAATRLSKAMVDLGRNAVTEDEAMMLQEAYEQGETMANYIQEIKGRVEGGWARTHFMRIIDTASIPFAGMERFNRRSSLLASYRMYIESGMARSEAFDLAKEFVRDAHYAYGLSNFPQLMRDGTPFSKIAGMAYVFKSFPHNYVLSMLHFAKDREGKLALGVMMRSVAMLMILGGLTAVPFLDDILDEYEKQTGTPVRSKMRVALRRYGGDMLGQVGMEGLPALAGIDMSGSTKMQIPIPGIGDFDPGTFTMGVWGGLADKGKRALEFAANNQWARAIEAGAPTGIEMMMKAARMRREGLKTGGERVILGPDGKPIVPTPYETISQVAGFRPERISEVQKERRTAQNIKEKFSKQRDNIRKRMKSASTREEFNEVRRAIERYNMNVMKYRGTIPMIDRSSLRSLFKPELGYMKYKIREEEL